MFNQQNYQGICEMSKDLSPSTIKKLSFKPFELDQVIMGSKEYPVVGYGDLEILPNIGEEIRLVPDEVPADAHGKLLVSSTFDEVKFEINHPVVDVESNNKIVTSIKLDKLISKENKTEADDVARNLLVTWPNVR